MSEASHKETEASGGDIYRQKKPHACARFLLARNIPGGAPEGRRGQRPPATAEAAPC